MVLGCEQHRDRPRLVGRQGGQDARAGRRVHATQQRGGSFHAHLHEDRGVFSIQPLDVPRDVVGTGRRVVIDEVEPAAHDWPPATSVDISSLKRWPGTRTCTERARRAACGRPAASEARCTAPNATWPAMIPPKTSTRPTSTRGRNAANALTSAAAIGPSGTGKSTTQNVPIGLLG